MPYSCNELFKISLDSISFEYPSIDFQTMDASCFLYNNYKEVEQYVHFAYDLLLVVACQIETEGV